MNQENMSPDQLFFRAIPQLSSLTQEQIFDLVRKTKKEKFKRGEHIFYQGDDVQRLYFLEIGKVEIYKSDINGKKLKLWHIEERDIFCLANLFSTDAFANAIALENSLVYSLSKEDFELIILASKDLSRNLICCISGKLATYSSLLDDFAFKKIEVRLAKILLHNFKKTEKYDYYCDISQEDLAEMIGTSREVVARCLKQFRDKDIVTLQKIGRHRLIIAMDYPALVQISAD